MSKITQENFETGALLGALEQIREVFAEVGFRDVNVDIWLTGASEEQMQDIGALMKASDRDAAVRVADGKSRVENLEDGYSIHALSLGMGEDA